MELGVPFPSVLVSAGGHHVNNNKITPSLKTIAPAFLALILMQQYFKESQ
jgi:hypothetical protein